MNQLNLQITHVIQDYNSPLTPKIQPMNEMKPVTPDVQQGIKTNGLKKGAVIQLGSMMLRQTAETIANRTGDNYILKDMETFGKIADTTRDLYITGSLGGPIGLGMYAAYKVADFAFQVDRNMRDRDRNMTARNEAMVRFGGFASDQTRTAGRGV